MAISLDEKLSTTRSYAEEWKRGLVTVVPFTVGIVPFAIAFAVAARSAGFSALEIQALSMIVFAGAAQMAAVSMFSAGAGPIAIILTTLVINLRHVIYGLSLNQILPEKPRPPRPVLAFLMVDETYGLAMSERHTGRGGVAYYFGASIGFYTVYSATTAAGIALGGVVPDLDRFGLLFVFPLVFVALLVPLLVSWRYIAVAITAGGLALVFTQFGVPGLTVLAATVGGAALGMLLEKR